MCELIITARTDFVYNVPHHSDIVFMVGDV